MNNIQIKELIDNELNKISEQQALKENLKRLISNEILKYLEAEDFNRLTPNQKQYTITSMTRLSLQYSLKLIKTDLEEDNINFIMAIIIESIFKVTIICIDAGFEKTERIKLLKDETLVSLQFALAVLKDESKIEEDQYTKILQMFN